MPKTKITGSAAGHKVPKVVQDHLDRAQIEAVMREAKVSEADALWLLKDGYWGRIMHMVRSAVVMRHAAIEEPEDYAE